MLLYDSPFAPNPRRVRIFLAEKGIDIPHEMVDLGELAQKSAEFTALNPFQRTPALRLGNGKILTESTAICRYLETLYPAPNLFGTDPLEGAEIEMWDRRIELGLFTFVASVFRHTRPKMAAMEVPQIAEWADANRPRVFKALDLLNDALGEHRFVAGPRFTIADITALCAVDFMPRARLAIPDTLNHVLRWHAEVSARPSAAA